jgi:hypothetical protein
MLLVQLRSPRRPWLPQSCHHLLLLLLLLQQHGQRRPRC